MYNTDRIIVCTVHTWLIICFLINYGIESLKVLLYILWYILYIHRRLKTLDPWNPELRLMIAHDHKDGRPSLSVIHLYI